MGWFSWRLTIVTPCLRPESKTLQEVWISREGKDAPGCSFPDHFSFLSYKRLAPFVIGHVYRGYFSLPGYFLPFLLSSLLCDMWPLPSPCLALQNTWALMQMNK